LILKKGKFFMSVKQKSSKETRKKLLQAAQKLFATHGFAGTSVNRIAKEVGVNPSLIYHYVKNKKELWREAKNNMFKGAQMGPEIIPINEIENLQDFLIFFIKHPGGAVKRDADLHRFIAWHLLEEDGEGSLFIYEEGPEEWVKLVKKMQEKKEIEPDSEPWIVLNMGLTPDF
jgi:AcrR family transcriptional regulator